MMSTKSAIIKSVFAVGVFSLMAAAQMPAKPKVAVYVTGGKTHDENRALSSNITFALSGSGRFVTIERSEIFLGQIDNELIAQRSGAVADSQIVAIGQQYGADLICVGDILEAFGSHQITVRLINVTTAEVVGTGVASGKLESISDLAAVSGKAIAAMIKVADARPYVFTDPRDKREYRVRRIGKHAWFFEDLDHNNKLFYTNAQASRACPPGWILPNDTEWETFRANASAEDIKEFSRKSNSAWWSTTGSVNYAKKKRVDYHIWHVKNNQLVSTKTRNELIKEANVRCVQDWE